MNKGFFAGSSLQQIKAPVSLNPKCGACGLHEKCKSKKMPYSGEGRKKIYVLAEAPGEDEDEQGKQLVGVTGRMFEEEMARAGIDLRRDCWLDNSLRCRPPNNEITDSNWVSYCRPNIINAVQELKPEKILLLGGSAVESLIGWLWKEDTEGIMRWAGFRIPNQRLNAWICPVFHPSYVMRKGKERTDENPLVRKFFRRHLKAAARLEGRPWPEGPPDYKKDIVVTHNSDQATAMIETFTKIGAPIAFDIETNMLKPDSSKAYIACCSVSDGITTIAFPWVGKAIEAMRELALSRVPKYGYNIKFEERWFRKFFGRGVRNWYWDGMQAAHVLDNRHGITSLKFQSFVHLGNDEYNSHIEDYLKSSEGGGNSENRIKEIDKTDLLVYCGMDSLLEWHVAKKQMELLGVE